MSSTRQREDERQQADDRPDEGLRERKKRATRQAISETALRLALEHGLDGLTVEEISAAAGISPRTFFNYFPTKEDALVGRHPLTTGEVDLVPLLSGTGGILDGLRRVALAGMADSPVSPAELRSRRELWERHPELLPQVFARFSDLERTLAAAVAERTGSGPGDLYPRLMAAVGMAAMKAATTVWAAGHGDRPLADYVNETFGLLTSELGSTGKET